MDWTIVNQIKVSRSRYWKTCLEIIIESLQAECSRQRVYYPPCCPNSHHCSCVWYCQMLSPRMQRIIMQQITSTPLHWQLRQALFFPVIAFYFLQVAFLDNLGQKSTISCCFGGHHYWTFVQFVSKASMKCSYVLVTAGGCGWTRPHNLPRPHVLPIGGDTLWSPLLQP